MTFARRQFLKFAGAAVAMPAVAKSGFAQSPQVTLKFHHFLPPVSNAHSKLWVPWVNKVQTESGGRIKIDIFPSMQLGGTPPQLYDQARDGVADLVWTLPGNTPGRFPSIEVMELPFVAAKRGIPNAKATQELFDTGQFRDEFAETKIICAWSHDHGVIHTGKAITKMEDLKGLKLRSPTRLAGEALKALGANGIPMPLPQLPESLAQRVLDGAVIPWEVVPAVKVQELLKFHTEIAGSPTLYTASFVLAMNKAKYESLPDDLKKVIDANSGQVVAQMAGQMWDDQAKAVEEMVRKRGNTVASINQEEAARWKKATEPVIEAWVKAAKDKGIDGEKLLANARALVAKYEKA
ncbi:sialic acid-binding periplasmic protein SiaP precursor [Variibacter gotjawalensis]|uniref:Sialic acid-binding periplasmic protein SiaP n=1 Tax=Variibacter gotjawalensis TaxID=1333996 RepID=A0A0S3PYY2_9BRAD|nr:TRAP transporter substrate-binding protein [Variibacter gotjawalensis]NIK46959.1 TRAP-type C4-dicarboxylate transport system substrate-binding protein [Variibacter gotjawalensis]RZS48863.1 TRAP-type C4-dicarboxylate transport system substrate-binding protein [Variibacter gotjawalensis]BAT61122.1 sialic acid-binding periplasmic protein SiaP precursor [Variibacter gotjawalensis]